MGGIILLELYQPLSSSDFWVLVGISQAPMAIDNLIAIKLTRRMWRPVTAWERGARDEPATIAAWTALATLPLEYLRRTTVPTGTRMKNAYQRSSSFHTTKAMNGRSYPG